MHAIAQSEPIAATDADLRVDERRMRAQAVSSRRRATSSGPPGAIRRTTVELAVGAVVITGTQELERPFINTVVVGGTLIVILAFLQGRMIKALTFSMKCDNIRVFLVVGLDFDGWRKKIRRLLYVYVD